MRQQARLLDFIQTRSFMPVGGNRVIKLDVRVIAATNKDLRQAIAEKKFREDLFHRLRVICLEVPPITERADEFHEIVRKCLEELSKQHQRSVPKISDEVIKALESYEWPGNVRELRNVLEYAIIAAIGGEVAARDLPRWFHESLRTSQDVPRSNRTPSPLGRMEMSLHGDYHAMLAAFEKELICRALYRTHGRTNQTARLLRMSKATLIRRMKAYQLYPLDRFDLAPRYASNPNAPQQGPSCLGTSAVDGYHSSDGPFDAEEDDEKENR